MITMKQFIEDNRLEIDTLIKAAWPEYDYADWNGFNDNQREDWVLNHEPLYILAQQAGVDV